MRWELLDHHEGFLKNRESGCGIFLLHEHGRRRGRRQEGKGVGTEGNKVFFCGGGKLIVECSSRMRREQMQHVTDKRGGRMEPGCP